MISHRRVYKVFDGIGVEQSVRVFALNSSTASALVVWHQFRCYKASLKKYRVKGTHFQLPVIFGTVQGMTS